MPSREVNAVHGDVVQLRVADDFPQSIAAYKQYDVLLVNAVYDGMNLVAKEGPLVNTRDGVLVLSENAGAYEELGGVGAAGESVRRLGPGRGAARGAVDGRARAPAPRRGHPLACAGERRHAWLAGLLADLDDAERSRRTFAA